MNKLCPLPFVSIEATPMGRARVCCLSTEDIPNIDLRENTLSEAFDSEYMKHMRFDFLLGAQPKNCRRCWDEEAAGRTSKRMHSIEKLKSMGISMTADMILNHPQALRFLDLKLGNICNLKCRICGSFSSSKWAAEEIAIYSKNKTARDNLANGRWIRESDRFWADLREIIEDVKYFEFTGGEPFLIDEHFDLLAAAVMMGHAQKIEIHYNTNTTVVPKIGLELWPHFKQVEIALSIDDLADRFEYQRYGTRWADTLSNLYTFQQLRANSKNITLQICCTVNVQNIFYLDEMCEWISQQGFDFVYFNVLHSMEHYCIKYLPKRAKQIISDKFHNYTGPYTEDVRGLLSFMWQGDDDRSSDLIRVLRQSDQQRNQHFRDSHPEMAEAIGYD